MWSARLDDNGLTGRNICGCRATVRTRYFTPAVSVGCHVCVSTADCDSREGTHGPSACGSSGVLRGAIQGRAVPALKAVVVLACSSPLLGLLGIQGVPIQA